MLMTKLPVQIITQAWDGSLINLPVQALNGIATPLLMHSNNLVDWNSEYGDEITTFSPPYSRTVHFPQANYYNNFGVVAFSQRPLLWEQITYPVPDYRVEVIYANGTRKVRGRLSRYAYTEMVGSVRRAYDAGWLSPLSAPPIFTRHGLYMPSIVPDFDLVDRLTSLTPNLITGFFSRFDLDADTKTWEYHSRGFNTFILSGSYLFQVGDPENPSGQYAVQVFERVNDNWVVLTEPPPMWFGPGQTQVENLQVFVVGTRPFWDSGSLHPIDTAANPLTHTSEHGTVTVIEHPNSPHLEEFRGNTAYDCSVSNVFIQTNKSTEPPQHFQSVEVRNIYGRLPLTPTSSLNLQLEGQSVSVPRNMANRSQYSVSFLFTYNNPNKFNSEYYYE